MKIKQENRQEQSALTLDLICDVDQAVAPLVGFIVKREGAVEQDERQASERPDINRCGVILALYNFGCLLFVYY